MSTTTDSLRFFQPKLRLLEVVTWDVPTITEEIARLQNSLQHLEATQKILKEQVDLEPDEIEWKVAFDENVETM
jgi:cell division protein FtsB